MMALGLKKPPLEFSQLITYWLPAKSFCPNRIKPDLLTSR